MSKRPIRHSRADVRAQWKLLEEIGAEPVSVKYHADGTFRIMTKKHAEITKPPPSPEVTENEWDEVLTSGTS